MEELRKLLRGEPLALRGIVLAVLAAGGVKVAPGLVDDIIAIAAPILLVVISRHKVTPAENPAVPTTIAVKPTDGGEEPAELPPMSLPPIRTLTGAKR